MLPEDDRMIETCRSVLSVLMFQIIKDYIYIYIFAFIGVLLKLQNARCNDKDVLYIYCLLL